MRKLYCILALQESVSIINQADGAKFEAPVVWYPGMVGAFPVFATRKQAEEVNPNGYDILEIEFPEKEVH